MSYQIPNEFGQPQPAYPPQYNVQPPYQPPLQQGYYQNPQPGGPIQYPMMMQQPQQQQQQPNIIIVSPVAAHPVVYGKFGAQFKPGATKRCGDLMISMGVFTLIGAMLETIGLAIYNLAVGSAVLSYIGSSSGLDYSLTSYAGYWCGALIITCGSIATNSASNRTDCMIIADMISAVVGIVFSIVVLALPAGQIDTASALCTSSSSSSSSSNSNSYSSYNYNYNNYNSYSSYSDYCLESHLMVAGYAVMIGCGSIAAIAAIILGVYTAIAIVKSLQNPSQPSSHSAVAPAPVQPPYFQQPPQPLTVAPIGDPKDADQAV